MSLKIGPETKRGRLLSASEYEDLWQTLVALPRGKLLELVGRLGIGWDPHDQPNGRIISDVAFGWSGNRRIESVHGTTIEQILAKAIALAVDQRLAIIAQAHADLGLMMRRAGDTTVIAAVARLVIAHASSAPTNDTAVEGRLVEKKAGERQ